MLAKTTSKINFAKSYDELQKLVEWFEKGDVDLEEGVKKFEEGIKLVGELKKYLGNIEAKVKQIKVKFENNEEDEEIEKEKDGKLF
ncbi:MAG: exodeoxyribonuclease VII small subunit [Candidatus Magasanikbacteria bacterium]|nr:exodeoxyribonuclease VII small subunit [Candidatus Magasanikbacteria bacterium]